MASEVESIYRVAPVSAGVRRSARQQRQAEQLRENLRKRKAQQRARAEAEARKASENDEPVGEKHLADIEV